MAYYQSPRKCILSQDQLAIFQSSKTHNQIVSYIGTLNEAVVGVKLTDPCSESKGVQAILQALDNVEEVAKATPAVDNSASRFGNPAFRTFYDKVSEVSTNSIISSRHWPRSITSPRKAIMQHCQIYQRRLSQRYLSTLSRLGEIGPGLIMGVGWSSIFYAGCQCHMMFFCQDPYSCISSSLNVGYVLNVWVSYRRAITLPWSLEYSGGAFISLSNHLSLTQSLRLDISR